MNHIIKNRLSQLADPKYLEFQSGLLPGVDGIIGVRLPHLRKLAKEISKGDWRQYLKEATDDSFEEIMLQGMVIGLGPADIEEVLFHTRNFVPKISNWAVCDSFCGGLKIVRKHQTQVLEFLRPYFTSDREFDIRFAAVMLLCHYIDDRHIDEVLSLLGDMGHEGYYAKMAVAWTLSMCFIGYPEKTMALLKNNHLDHFTYNNTLQKIMESLRVDGETKSILRLMKRKPGEAV